MKSILLVKSDIKVFFFQIQILYCSLNVGTFCDIMLQVVSTQKPFPDNMLNEITQLLRAISKILQIILQLFFYNMSIRDILYFNLGPAPRCLRYMVFHILYNIVLLYQPILFAVCSVVAIIICALTHYYNCSSL